MTMPDAVASDEDEIALFAREVGRKPSFLRHFASAKGMVAAFVTALGMAFGAGRYLQSITLDIASAKADASAARTAAAAMASAPDVPELRQRVVRVEAQAADMGLELRQTGEAVRRIEGNTWVSCVRVGGAKCIPPVSLVGTLSPVP